ncbi:unnamed protein product, partial [Medioppia subpectinata]
YCGDPGLPPDATLYNVNTGRIRYHSGEVVRYRCSPDFHTFSQTRKCVSGRWVGEMARCGIPIENDIQLVQVFNCSDSENSTTNNEILNLQLNQTENPLLFANSFHASRHESGPITVNGSECYIWKFKLQRPTIIPFLTIDFATQLNPKETINASVDDFNVTSMRTEVLIVEPFVSPYRICRRLSKSDFLNGDPITNSTYLLSGYYFRCDNIGENEYKLESKRVSQTFLVQTRTQYRRDVHLVAVFLATHKIDHKTDKPECGKPETVSTGVNFRESNLGLSQFQFQCNDSFSDMTPNRLQTHTPVTTTAGNPWYSMNCTINGFFKGQFPICVPKTQCPGIEYLEETKDPSVVIESLENVFYLNASHWVPTEYSHVNYGCIDAEHIVIGRLSRICLKGGIWSSNVPKCSAYVTPDSLSPVAQSPWTVIALMKELMRYRNKSRRKQTSVYADVKSSSIYYIYDDCETSTSGARFGSRPNNRVARKSHPKYKYDAEYIDFEGSSSVDNSEPLYIPILPPT